MDTRRTEAHVAAILNAWWMVRHYERGGRLTIQRLQRQQAIFKLGLTVREAFNACDDFEPLLAAMIEGARPKDGPAF